MFEIFFQKPRGNSEKQFGVILEKDILFGDKKKIERVRLTTAKRKKTKPKRRRKNGVSQRDEKS